MRFILTSANIITMAKAKKTTKEVAAPKIKTTTHKIIKAGLGHAIGDTVVLGLNGVTFYKKKQLIK